MRDCDCASRAHAAGIDRQPDLNLAASTCLGDFLPTLEPLNNSPIGTLEEVPDETTILNFRRLLETHDLARKLFNRVAAHLLRKGQSLRGGTIVDATIIAAPSSTKN